MREITKSYFKKKGSRWIKTTADKIPSRSPTRFFGRTDGLHLLSQTEYTKGSSGWFKTITKSRRMKD